MVSDKVKALLAISGKRQVQLADEFGMSKQVMCNKLRLERFSASDLIRIADFTDCKLCFELPDGQKMYLTKSDISQTIEESANEKED